MMTNDLDRSSSMDYFGYLHLPVFLTPFVLSLGEISMSDFGFFFLITGVMVSYCVFVFVLGRSLKIKKLKRVYWLMRLKYSL